MLTLAIDTTGPACDIALMRGREVMAARLEEMARGQEAMLAAMTGQVLEEAGVRPGEIGRIAVVTGPGSFTGTRVGVAFARGLALGLKVKAVGVSSLMASLPDPAPEGLCLMLRPAQLRPPGRTWWGQVFCDGAVRSLPFEMDEAQIGGIFGHWDGRVLLAGARGGVDGAPQALVGVTQLCGREAGSVRAGLWAEGVSAAAFPPVPAYVRAPDAALPGGSG